MAPPRHVDERRLLLGRARRRLALERAARAEAAARRRRDRARDLAVEHDPRPRPLDDRIRDDGGREQRLRVRVLRRARRAPRAGASSTILPRYITATRSQRYSTVARSWLMNRHEKPSSLLEVAQQVEDRRLHGDVERGHGLVRDQQASARRSARARGRRAGAARRRARAGSGSAAPARSPTASNSSATRASSSRAAREPVQPDRLADDLPAGHARVERRVRVLEDDVHLAPERPQLAAREVRDVGAVEPDRARRSARAAG